MPDKKTTLDRQMPPNDKDEAPDNKKDNVSEEVLPPDDLVPEAIIESVSSDQWVLAHQAYYDRGAGEELTTVLICTIAEAKEVDPLNHSQMPSLFEVLDAEALEETFFGLFKSKSPRKQTGVMMFNYTGYKVVLRADGWIFVYEPR